MLELLGLFIFDQKEERTTLLALQKQINNNVLQINNNLRLLSSFFFDLELLSTLDLYVLIYCFYCLNSKPLPLLEHENDI